MAKKQTFFGKYWQANKLRELGESEGEVGVDVISN